MSADPENVSPIAQIGVSGTPNDPVLHIQQLAVRGAVARALSAFAGDEHALEAQLLVMLEFVGSVFEHGAHVSTVEAVGARVTQLSDRVERATTDDIPAAVAKLTEGVSAELAKLLGSDKTNGEFGHTSTSCCRLAWQKRWPSSPPSTARSAFCAQNSDSRLRRSRATRASSRT